MPFGHACMRRILPVARVEQDVVGAHNAFAVKGRREDLGIARHREFLEVLPIDTGERIEHVAAALAIIDIVEEGAEFRAGQHHAGIDDNLGEAFDTELGGDGGARPVDDRKRVRFHAKFFQRHLLAALGRHLVGDIKGRTEDAGDCAVIAPRSGVYEKVNQVSSVRPSRRIGMSSSLKSCELPSSVLATIGENCSQISAQTSRKGLPSAPGWRCGKQARRRHCRERRAPDPTRQIWAGGNSAPFRRYV